MRAAGWLRAFVLISCVLACRPVAGQDLSSLAAGLRSGDTEAKRTALFAIRNLQNESASRLAIEALRDRAPIVRATAAFSVIFLPPAEAVQSLLPNLKDGDEFVRRETAYALGEVRSPSAVSELIERALHDRSLGVRSAAAIALGNIADTSGAASLVSILDERAKEDNEFLRASAARSLGQIAWFARTGERLTLAPQNFLPARYKSVAPLSEPVSVSQMPIFRSAFKKLLAIVDDNRQPAELRRQAAFAVGAIGHPDGKRGLDRCAQDADIFFAEVCRESLLRLAPAK